VSCRKQVCSWLACLICKVILLHVAKERLRHFKRKMARYNNSSGKYWQAFVRVWKRVKRDRIPRRTLIVGLSFDATCSMVVMVKTTTMLSGARVLLIVMLLLNDQAGDETSIRLMSLGTVLKLRWQSQSRQRCKPPNYCGLKTHFRNISQGKHFWSTLLLSSVRPLGQQLDYCTVVCKDVSCPWEPWRIVFWTPLARDDIGYSISLK